MRPTLLSPRRGRYASCLGGETPQSSRTITVGFALEQDDTDTQGDSDERGDLEEELRLRDPAPLYIPPLAVCVIPPSSAKRGPWFTKTEPELRGSVRSSYAKLDPVHQDGTPIAGIGTQKRVSSPIPGPRWPHLPLVWRRRRACCWAAPTRRDARRSVSHFLGMSNFLKDIDFIFLWFLGL